MEYTVKIDKVDTQNMSYDSSAECLEIALEEYRHVTAYSAKPAQPFQWNGALFRFNLNVVQID